MRGFSRVAAAGCDRQRAYAAHSEQPGRSFAPGAWLCHQLNFGLGAAAQLSVREDTVESHVGNILDKLGANDRTHSVTIGLMRGIIEL